jgi:hypothetical protein
MRPNHFSCQNSPENAGPALPPPVIPERRAGLFPVFVTPFEVESVSTNVPIIGSGGLGQARRTSRDIRTG